MSEKQPSSNQEVIQQGRVRIEEAKKTVLEFLEYIGSAFDGFPSQEEWKRNFDDFRDSHGGYTEELESELLNEGREAMKARLLEDFTQYAQKRGLEGIRKFYINILRF